MPSFSAALRLSALSLVLAGLLGQPSRAQDTTQPAPEAPAAEAPAAEAPAAAPAPVAPETVVAVIDGKPITEADVQLNAQEFGERLDQLPPEQRRAAALAALIEVRLVAARGRADGLDKGPDFQRLMAFLEERALQNQVIEKEVTAKATDEQVRARYDQEIASQPPVNEVHARHILVATKEEAEAIIKQLDGGAKFEDLANQHTTDPSGKESGGDLGWFGPGQMVPEFEQAAMALQPGSYSKTPVQTQFGWHVIKVDDKRQQQPPAFDQVKDQIRQLVLRDAYTALVKDLKAKAAIEIKDPALKAALDQANKAQ